MTNDYKTELIDLLETVIKESASDLHLSEGRNPTIRVAGALIPLARKPVLKRDDTDAMLSLLVSANMKTQFEKVKELDFSYSFNERARFRGNAYYQQGHVSIALRLIPKQIKSIEDLRLPPLLADFARRKQGFFLVVGPVGQGKTTTLAAMVELINEERAEHVVTIEDPVEYIYDQKKSIIDQREIHIDTNDFSIALTEALREDVNVLLVGEMRNPETMAAAVTAAETGQ